MAKVVICPHCSASHRTVGGQTRFTCDYCQSLVVVTTGSGVEELVVPAAPSPRKARSAAARWLARKGVHRPTVQTLEAFFVPLWHVVARSGEEHTLCGVQDPPALIRGLDLPAAPVVSRDDERARELEPLPTPAISAAEAESAAMATFRDADPAVESVRLIWLPAVTLRVATPGGDVDGLYLAGADQVVFEPLPPGARDLPVDRDRLVAYGVFLGLAALLGLALPSPALRAGVEAGLVLAAWAVFRSWARPSSMPRKRTP